MTDHKTENFKRINDPRVEKIVKMIDVIAKSAASMRIHELDVARMFQPVTDKIRETVDEDAVAMTQPAPSKPVAASPFVAREIEVLEHLTTQQLVDRMIAAGAILADRRK